MGYDPGQLYSGLAAAEAASSNPNPTFETLTVTGASTLDELEAGALVVTGESVLAGTDTSGPLNIGPDGSALVEIRVYTFVWDPVSIPANSTEVQGRTITGLAVGDIVLVSKPTNTAGMGVGNAWVDSTNELRAVFFNVTASPIDPPSETYKLLAIRAS